MNHSKLIDELLNELSYRVGIVNLKNKNQQSIISEILSEWGEYEAKQIIMEFLTNEDVADTEGDDKDYTHLGAGIYVRKGDEDKDSAQKYKKDDRGSLKAISNSEYEKTKADQGEEGEKAAADTPQNQQSGGEQSEEDLEAKKNVQKTFNTPSQKAQREREKEIADKIQKDKEGSTPAETPDTSTFQVDSKRSNDIKIQISEKLSKNLDFIEENYDKVRLKTGGGSNSPSVQDVKDLKEFTEKRMAQDKRRKEALDKGEEFNEEVYVHPSIIQRKVSDVEVESVMNYFEEKLSPAEFGKLLKKFSAGGAVPRHLTKVTKLKKGDEGYPGIDKNSPGYIRAKKILKLYLKNDCKSPVTGKPLPLSHMEPDHRLPFTTAESDIVESGKYEGLTLKAKNPADGNSLQEIMKKRKDQLSEREQNIIKDLEPLQAKYDDPDTNMDLMAGPVNQFKSDLIDNDLLNSIRRKLAENPEEKKLQNEYKTLRKKLIREHHADKVSRGDNPPYNEYDIRNADSIETNAMMKAHNFYHPDAKTITELEGGDPSKGIPPDPQYYDKVKAFWKEKGIDLPENKEDIDFTQHPFNKTLTVYVQAGRSRGGAKRRSKGQDHEYMIQQFKEFSYFGSSLEDDKNQEEVIDDARKEMNKKLDTKRIEILKVQLADPNIQGKKRENRQKELNSLVAIHGEN